MCARIAAAMSGGVDSSAAAWLLKQQGHDVAGVTLKMFERVEPGEAQDIQDARSVAQRLGIPYHVFDVTPCFQAQVMDRFAAAYEAGETPNPCVDCNRHVKFGTLLELVRGLDREAVATGHYARVEYDQGAGRWLLKRAGRRAKDQSYVLWSLTQDQLAHTLFPLGGLQKSKVRKIAWKAGLANAGKRDSQDICFAPDGDYAAAVERISGRAAVPGDFVDTAGRVLGTHRGVIHYTVGQRRGLGISAPERLYVCGVSAEDNTVTLGGKKALLRAWIEAGTFHWISGTAQERPFSCGVKLRSTQKELPATAYPAGKGRVRVVFDEPQRSPAPGQAAVLYDGDTVLGGGEILPSD